MKVNFSFVFAVSLATLIAAAPVTLGQAGQSRLPFAKGRIRYKVTGLSGGAVTYSWIEYGRKFRQDIKTSAPGGSKPSAESWTMCDGKAVYFFTPALGKIITRMTTFRGNPEDSKDPHVMKSPYSHRRAAGISDVFSKIPERGALAGRGTVLGRPCEIRKGGQTKAWLWKGLPLRLEINAGKPTATSWVATDLDTAPKLSPDLFRVPAGYTVRDLRPPTYVDWEQRLRM